MFTTGFKYFFGITVFALAAGLVYAIGTGEGGLMSHLVGPMSLGYMGTVGNHLGYSLFLGLAVVSLGLACFLSAVRDADPQSVAEVARTETTPRALPPQEVNVWPAIAALGVAMTLLGLVTSEGLFLTGIFLGIAATVEWTVCTWSERVSIDRAVASEARSRLMAPLEVPLQAAMILAYVVILGSRVLLAVSELGSVIVATVMATIVFVIAIVLSLRPSLNRQVLHVLLAVGAVLLLVSGVAAAANGEREFERHGSHETEAPADGDGGGHAEALPSPIGAQG